MEVLNTSRETGGIFWMFPRFSAREATMSHAEGDQDSGQGNMEEEHAIRVRQSRVELVGV